MSFLIRPETAGERRADAVLHVLGAVASIAGIIVIARSMPFDAEHVAAALLYIIGACAMFGCSALYNLTMEPRLKGLFQRCDHAAIFLMIAGTYTPLTLLALRGGSGAMLLTVVWSVALIGAALKLVWPNKYDPLAIAAYVGLGWTGIAFLPSLLKVLPQRDIAFIFVGGMFYTSGVVFHLWRRLKFQNAIWHAFVLAGAVVQFGAVFDVVRA